MSIIKMTGSGSSPSWFMSKGHQKVVINRRKKMRKTFFIVISLVIGLILGTSVSWADINSGLVSYWPFNDNLNDVTGNGYDGEMINGTVSYIQGVKGKGIKLPGTADSRISIVPWIPVNSSLTISGWVKI